MYRNRHGMPCDATEALDARGALRDGYTINRTMMLADAAPAFAADRLTVADLAKVGALPSNIPPGVVTTELQEIAQRLAAVPSRAEAESIIHAVEVAHATIRVGLERDRQYAAMGQMVGPPSELEAEFRGREAALSWLETVHTVLKGATAGLRDAAAADAFATGRARADAAYDAGRDDLSNAWRN